MKTHALQKLKFFAIIFVANFLLLLTVSAQNEMSISESFNNISIDGPITVFLKKSDKNSIELLKNHNDLGFEELLKVNVKDNQLHVKSTGKSIDLHIRINYQYMESLKAAGVANVKTEGKVVQQSLGVQAEGAADVDIEAELEKLTIDGSGAATMRLSGKADDAIIKASGAADIKAANLKITNATINTSGASSVKADVAGRASVTASGASGVRFNEKPEDVTTELTGVASVKFGEGEVVENIVPDYSTYSGSGKEKFNGHWGGVELGFNAFVNSDFSRSLPSEYDFLKLNQAKSKTVQLNFWEYNIGLAGKQFGMITGLGLWINNYRFNKNIILVPDSSTIYGYADTTRNYLKSKLTASYLVLPLIFEYQLHSKKSGKEIFHIGVGGYGGVKLGMKTKTVYLDDNSKIKTKSHDDYKLNPFKYGLTARIGVRWFNVFANYNLSAAFKKNQGPDVYPFEVGITLLGW